MKNSDLRIKVCDEHDVNQIVALQEDIFSEMNDEGATLRRNTREMFELCVTSPNLTLGIYAGRVLVGICVLFYAKGTAEDLSTQLTVYDSKKIHNPVNLKLVMLRKDYRGHGLQRYLMWIAEKIAFRKGYDYLCVSVSPSNEYSIKNCKALGYQYDHTAVKYGGYDRHIYVKKNSAGEYRAEVAELLYTLEGNKNPDAVISQMELDNCFKGNMDIITTGDVLEFKDPTDEKLYYGICFGEDKLKVILWQKDDQCLRKVDYNYQIGSLELNGIWLNANHKEEPIEA